VSNKAVYLALGIQADGQRDVLGLWIEQSEGAKFWLKVEPIRDFVCEA
jgi:transposase-like protein